MAAILSRTTIHHSNGSRSLLFHALGRPSAAHSEDCGRLSLSALLKIAPGGGYGGPLEIQWSGGHIAAMSKSPRVIFQPKRIAEDDWQIEAHYPGAEIRYIKGLKSKAEIDDWLQGSRRRDWLRSHGYAK